MTFDKIINILRVVKKNNKLKTPYFSKLKVKPLFLLTTAVLDIYSFPLPFLHIYSFSLDAKINIYIAIFYIYIAIRARCFLNIN